MNISGTKFFILLLTLIIAFGGAAIAQEEDRLPLISVVGNTFVDENGNEIIFRGVSTADPDKIEKEGIWNRELFAELKDWGVNVVRFPVHPTAWRERGEQNYLELLDSGIELASELGMYVIIDWHSMGNLKTELFFKSMYVTTKTETFRFWKTIASRYIDNPTVAFYELFNEPTRDGGRLGKITWQQHKELMEEIIGIIYAHDDTVIPLVAGYNWAYELEDVVDDPISYPGVAYVTHPYPQKQGGKPWLDKWEKSWGHVADYYPVIATEFGFMTADGRGAHVPVIVEDLEYGETIVDYFSKKGISWVAWVFDPHWSPQMIDNWDYEPTMQGEFFKQKMLELNYKN